MALVPALDLAIDPRERGDHPAAANIEAEQALIGCVLFDNAAFHELQSIEARHFYEPFHARLFQSISEHIGRGRLAEPIVLMEQFKRDPAFEELGGLRYLADLVDRAPPASQANHYAQVVVETWTRRELVKIGGEMALAAKGAEERPAADIIGQAEADLLAVQAHSQGPRLITAGAAAMRVMDALAAPPDQRPGIYTGLTPLDSMLGPLLPGDLVLFMGRPSMGKSAAAECVALNLAENDAGGIQINGEMTVEQMVRRHMTDLTFRRYGYEGPKYSDIRKGDVSYEQAQMLAWATRHLEPLPLMMMKRPGITLPKLRSIARRQKAAWLRDGRDLKFMIVDHAGHVKADDPRLPRYEAQTFVSNGLKELADELEVVMIALNQMSRQNEQRDDKRPQLSDLRDSGSWEQDADFVVGWYREAYYAQREPEPKDDGKDSARLKWDDWDRRRRSRVIEAIVLKAREGGTGTAELWGDVARNAIRGAEPEGLLL